MNGFDKRQLLCLEQNTKFDWSDTKLTLDDAWLVENDARLPKSHVRLVETSHGQC